MDGIRLTIKLTGKGPVYPGHPLVGAVQIMHTFPSIAQASELQREGWPAALGDQRISGAGCHVHAALNVLRAGAEGMDVDGMIAKAQNYWEEGQAGGHVKNVQDGIDQARAVEPHFRKVAQKWLAGHGIPPENQIAARG